jgi:hypothetical protein
MPNIFKKKNTNHEIVEDEFFGKLSYVKETSYEPSHLFGSKIFVPLHYEVEYQIYNDDKMISQEQRFLLNEIEKRYIELEDEIEMFINSEVEKVSTERKKYELQQDLELRLIVIPKNCTPIIEWSLEYGLKKDFAFFTVEFQDWKPIWFSISA